MNTRLRDGLTDGEIAMDRGDSVDANMDLLDAGEPVKLQTREQRDLLLQTMAAEDEPTLRFIGITAQHLIQCEIAAPELTSAMDAARELLTRLVSSDLLLFDRNDLERYINAVRADERKRARQVAGARRRKRSR